MKVTHLLILGLILLSPLISANEQNIDSVLTDTTKVEKRVDLSLMPFFSYNRNLRLMLGVLPMAMYRLNPNDTISPKSLSGISAIYTTNGTYILGFFNRLHFAEDRWRVMIFMLNGDINSQFYTDDVEMPGFYEFYKKTTYVSIGVKRKIYKKLYGGLAYTFANHLTDYEDEVYSQSHTRTNGLEASLQLDRRSSVYYPTTGQLVNLKLVEFPKWFGNEVFASKLITEYNQYIPVRNKKDVIAARFAGKFGLGDIAFEQQVTVGNKDIRGYSEGKYRGDGLVAIQGEYRYNFKDRMGLVGFAGVATIYGSDTESFNGKLLPGVGVGYRYRAFKTVKFNIGLDVAAGIDDWGVNFRIGEAF